MLGSFAAVGTQLDLHNPAALKLGSTMRIVADMQQKCSGTEHPQRVI